ncbi:MAG: Glyceraldehyde-3-phosphate dehydrogenase [Microgenomates group bacterium GW2011_GWA2_37_6]|nr:MAG: Glyceraldehyde-3-phosphate dehydrogenase [Microgenomates group bacterium GW2011_GWA2_37_6]
MIRVAINGYGRIGRMAHRVILEKYKTKVDVVAINVGSSTDLKGWMYLLKYDTVYGRLRDEVTIERSRESKKDLLVVIESTGRFLSLEKANLHLKAGAKNVVLSAPAKGENIETYVLSVNDADYSGSNVISNASCTTNCIAPVAKVIADKFGIEKAMMTTIHGYTQDQRLQDGGHEDYRRARAAAENIVPTSTGATVAAAKALPELEGKFSGLAIRVPVPVGSLSDFTFVLRKNVSVEEVNGAFKEAASSSLYKNILEVTEDPIVSSDIIGNPYSAIVDLSLTQVVGGNMVKVIAWYDNEYGYANRLVEEVLMVGSNSR